MAQHGLSLRGEGVPRVVFFGFASCFGCQLQVTNEEAHLMEVLGQIDLGYWQLVSGEALPQDFDVAIIEGAVTTTEARDLLLEIRKRAKIVIGMGACALTGGIPGLASQDVAEHVPRVYGESLPAACGQLIAPSSINAIVDVDFEVPCCPIDFARFADILQRALYGSNKTLQQTTLCGECKVNGTQCLYEQGQICLGLVTRAGCGARCPGLGRACNGCAGMSPDCNLSSASAVVESFGGDVERFRQRLRLFNAGELDQQLDQRENEALEGEKEGGK